MHLNILSNHQSLQQVIQMIILKKNQMPIQMNTNKMIQKIRSSHNQHHNQIITAHLHQNISNHQIMMTLNLFIITIQKLLPSKIVSIQTEKIRKGLNYQKDHGTKNLVKLMRK